MSPQRISTPQMAMADRTGTFLSCLYITMLSMCISSAMALSLGPNNRYLGDMGRMLRDPQLHVAQSPTEIDIDTETDATLEYNGGDTDWNQFQPASSFHKHNTVDENTPPEQAEKKTFATPHPPRDPYFQKQRELFGGYYAQNQTPNKPNHQRKSASQPPPAEVNHQPRRDSELFEALNGHIEALDQQMQTSNLRSVTDEMFPDPEQEWGYDAQDGYFQAEEDYSSSQSDFQSVEANVAYSEEDYSYSQTEFQLVEENGSYYGDYSSTELSGFQSVEANGSFQNGDNLSPGSTFQSDEANGSFQSSETNGDNSSPGSEFQSIEANGAFQQAEANGAFQPAEANGAFQQAEANGSFHVLSSQPAIDSFEATEQFTSYDDPNAALTQDLERLAAEKRAAEEAAQRVKQQLREEKRRHEREMLEQERIIAERAEAARAELKRALDREMIRHKEQRKMSIIKSRFVPQLPDTSDPFELLGLDSRNPPGSEDTIRRAFLKMAKKYHPDAVASDATHEEREIASLSFAKVNSAYQHLKDKYERLREEQTFATMLGGPMYQPRNGNVRQSFSHGHGFDDYGSGGGYAGYGPANGRQPEQPQPQNGNHRNPFRRRRRGAGDSCHVSADDFPPFFNN